jgi:hypothetical protein
MFIRYGVGARMTGTAPTRPLTARPAESHIVAELGGDEPRTARTAPPRVARLLPPRQRVPPASSDTSSAGAAT